MPNDKPKDKPVDPSLSTKFSQSVAEDRIISANFPDELPAGVDPEEFTGYTGENVNPYTQDLRRMRAQEQGVGEQLVNFGVNLATEITGGTVESAGYILGLPKMAMDYFSGSEVSIGNAISEAGREIKEAGRENFPIYTEEQGGFNPGDTGWWFNNGVSIVSTLSLLLPATAAARGVSAVGRGIASLAGLSRVARGRSLIKALGGKSQKAFSEAKDILAKQGITGETVGQAVFSRHAENLMEAAPLYEEKYNEYIEQGLPESVARQKASEAAATVYKWNSLFLLQDIGTFGLLNKASRRIRSKWGGTKAAAIPEGPSWRSTLIEIGTEGAEEAYQYAVSEEASILADQSAGIIEPSVFSDRLSAYMNGEMATNALFGALGAGVFRYVGSRAQALWKDKTFEQTLRREIEKAEQEKGEPLTEEEKKDVVNKTAARKTRDVGQVFTNFTNAAQRIDDALESRRENGQPSPFLNGMKAILGNVKHLEGQGTKATRVDELLEMSDEDFRNAIEDPTITKEDLEDYKYVLDRMESIHKNNQSQYGKYAPSITLRQSENLLRQKLNQKKLANLEASKENIPDYNALEPKGKRILDATYKLRGIERAIDNIKKDKDFPNADQMIENLEGYRDTQQSIIEQEKAKEQKGGQQAATADQDIINASEGAINELAEGFESIALSNAAMKANTNKINEIKEKAKQKPKPKKKPEQETQQEEEPAEQPTEFDYDQEGVISTPFNSSDQVNVGDEVMFSQKGNKGFRVTEENGKKGIILGGIFNSLEDLLESTQGYQLYKITSPEQAQREAKENLDADEVEDYSEPVADEYEKRPVSTPPRTQESDGKYLSWISANSEKRDESYRSDPEVVARTNWAESVESIENPDGTPKYYLEFQADENATATGREPIKAILKKIDEQGGPGETVTDVATGADVFFYLDAPSGKNYDDALIQIRETVLNGLKEGKTMVAQLTSKSEGMWRYGSEKNSVREILGMAQDQQPELVILKKDRTYRNSKGQFTGVGLGNASQIASQIGRVYATTTGLNGQPKVIPLERETLNTSLVNAVTQIVDDIISRDAQPGDRVSEQVINKLQGKRAEALLEVVGKNPTNRQLLDHIVLEGKITNKLADHKKFHIKFEPGKGNGTLKFGGNQYSFRQFRENKEAIISELSEFLSNRWQNVLIDNLGTSSYDNYLANYVLYQNIDIVSDGQILHQPDLRFSTPREANFEDAVADQQVEDISEVTYKGNSYEITPWNAVINKETGKELDSSSSYARAILAKAAKESPEVIDNNNKEIDGKKEDLITPLTEEDISSLRIYAKQLLKQINASRRHSIKGYSKKLDNLIKEYQDAKKNLSFKEFEKKDLEMIGKLGDTLSGGSTLFMLEGAPDSTFASRYNQAFTGAASKDFVRTLKFVKILLNEGSQADINGLTEQQQKDLQDEASDMFGDDAPFQLLKSDGKQGLLPVLNMLKKRFNIPYVLVNSPDAPWNGVYDNDTVFINLARAGLDTAFHEYAHPIIRQIKNNSPILYASLTNDLINNRGAKAIYTRVKARYPEYTPEQVIEETIVQLIGEYASANQSTKSVIDRIWTAIKRFLNSVFNLKTDISDLPPTATIRDIADLLTGSNFMDVSGVPMTAYSRVDSQMSYKETNSWLNSMMYILLTKNDISDYTDANKLDFSTLREFLENRRMDNKPQHIVDSQQRVMNSLFNEDGSVNRESPWYQAINDKLAAFDIVVDQRLSIEEVDDVIGFDYSPDYMFDGRETASSFIRMLFSTVPKTTPTGYDINVYTGMPEFHSFNDMWNLATKALASTVEKPVEPIFNTFMEKLSEYTNLRPELKVLVGKLQKMPEWKKKKFVQAFYKVDQNYSTLLYSNGKFKLIRNTPTPAEQKIAVGWKESFEDKFLDGDNVKEDLRDSIVQKYEEFAEDWATYHKRQKNPDGSYKPGPIKKEFVDRFTEILSDIGFDADPRIIDYVATKKSIGKKEALDFLINQEGLNYIIGGKSSLKAYSSIASNNPIDDQSASQLFIEAQAFFKQDLGTQSVFGPGNNQYYNYSNYSMMRKLLDYYKQSPDLIEDLKKQSFYAGSKWLDHIQDLEITNNISLRTQGQQGTKMSQLNPVDRLIADINKTLRGQFGMIARGANATEFNIVGAPFVKAHNIDPDGNSTISSQALDQLMGYVYDELARSYDTESFINDPDVPESRYVDGYHNKEKTGLRSFLMPKLNQNERFVNPDGTFAKVKRQDFISDKKLRQQVRDEIKQQVNEVSRFLRENGLTRQKLESLITADRGYNTSNNFDAKMYDYVVNGMIANIEQQKLFAADTAMFATGKDGDPIQDTIANMQKRILANGSMGLSWDFSGQNEFYRSAVIQDAIIDSEVYKYYKGVNATDAQAWVIFNLYIDALKGYGKWTPEHQQALERIQKGTYTGGDIALLAQPLKTVHFERVNEDGLIRPTYDKQTILPLIPQVVQNSSLNNLLINMEAEGIDHVTVESGKKLGRVSPTEAIDPETGKFKEDFDLNGFSQSKRYTFLQTEIPTKGVSPTPMGSQQRYNILSGIDPDLEYNGKNVLTEMHIVNNALSDMQLQEELTNEITDERGNVDPAKLRGKLIKLSKQGEIDRNVIDFLHSGHPIESHPSYNLSLQSDLMSLVKKAGVRVKHTNALTLIQTSSIGFDQLSEAEYSDIVWLDKPGFKPPTLEDGQLKPGQMLIPHDIIEKYDIDLNSTSDKKRLREILSGVDYRIPNQAPSNIGFMEAVGILPRYMGDTVVVYPELNEKSGSDNDGDKVYLMLYNYAGEGKPSKVKYWTEESGNKKKQLEEIYEYRTNILGENIGTKRSFVTDHMNQPILYANSKLGVENYMVDLYREIMSTEEGFKRMTNKLEDDTFEKLIKDHPNYDAQNPVRHFELVSPFHQIKVRDSFVNAKSGVGQVSNHILDHIKSQHKEIYTVNQRGEPLNISGLEVNTIEVDGETAIHMDKIYNVDGKRISNILSSIMNSQVDAEKDDYAAKGNFNTETNSVAIAMIRAGAREKDVVDLIGSEDVRVYSRYKRMKKSTFTDFDGDPMEFTLKELGIKEPSQNLMVYSRYEDISQGLSMTIQQNKFSVNAGGGTFASAMAYEHFKDQFVPYLANTHRKFEREDGGPSMEDNFFNNSVMYAKDKFGEDSLAFSQAFHDIITLLEKNSKFEKINLITGDPSQTEKLYRAFYGYVMGEVFADVNPQSLITGKNTVAQQLRDYKGDNALVDYLIPTRYGKFDLIKTSSAVKVNTDIQNQLSEAWHDLYLENESLAKNLAAYAYFQSNYERNFDSFYEFMPEILFEELGFPQAYARVHKQSQAGFEGFVDQYIRNNANDNFLVPTLQEGDWLDNQMEGVNIANNQINVQNSEKISATFGNAKVQYVKIYSGQRIILYERVEGNTFQETVPLGLAQDGHRFAEYNLHNYPVSSIFREGSASTVIDGNIERFRTQEINRTDDWIAEDNNEDNPLCSP